MFSRVDDELSSSVSGGTRLIVNTYLVLLCVVHLALNLRFPVFQKSAVAMMDLGVEKESNITNVQVLIMWFKTFEDLRLGHYLIMEILSILSSLYNF